MKKRLFSLALASVMALSLAGCGGSKEAATEAETKAETEQTAEDTSAKAEDTTAQEETKAESEAASEAVSESAGGTLIVGFDQDFPPMGFMGDNGEYTGFDLELAKEVAERLGLEYTAQPIAWDSKDMELEAGNIDCIWNGFTMTGREDDYTWSEPYMANTQVFVVAKDSGIASQASTRNFQTSISRSLTRPPLNVQGSWKTGRPTSSLQTILIPPWPAGCRPGVSFRSRWCPWP